MILSEACSRGRWERRGRREKRGAVPGRLQDTDTRYEVFFGGFFARSVMGGAERDAVLRPDYLLVSCHFFRPADCDAAVLVSRAHCFFFLCILAADK
jgi:hypothetical protein